ncbi:MAG: HslU--HslV peptidase ATPase subunit [Candidatus Cloacimonetes bacterium 4572_65]|nr:MAG: HslU--HslV peptidase ATPase subunit [Candidatus Cloacimonetes bacterium 4572_65]
MFSSSSLTPQKIVNELDKYIIGQNSAKKAVAIALRNRWRRQHVCPELINEIAHNNIIMIGPTGVGKTEIARRLSKLTNAPFIKVEASKFTEVGYVGRDVESMIRELMSLAINQVNKQMLEEVQLEAFSKAKVKVLDKLISPIDTTKGEEESAEELAERVDRYSRSREKMSKMLDEGKLDERSLELEVLDSNNKPKVEVFSNNNFEMMDLGISDMLGNIMKRNGKKRKRKLSVKEAITFFQESEAQNLVKKENVISKAKELVENHGIIFIDEIDKIATSGNKSGADVSRSGVQRDLLPIVEGSSVPTKHGIINTDHILFIAAGAFHVAKPSDLIPELQGRFPIRVELSSLTNKDFEKILTIPENSLTKQYIAMFETENVELTFTDDSVDAIAFYAFKANEKMEDIGARRLHTILNKLMEKYLFEMPTTEYKEVLITEQLVKETISDVVENEDLSRYIL